MTKPIQLMPELLIMRDLVPEPEDYSHAPTTRAAIDKERIEELEAEVKCLKAALRWIVERDWYDTDQRNPGPFAQVARAALTAQEVEGNRVKPGFDIEPITRT